MSTAQTARALRLRIVVPAYPAFNIYSRVADKTTALGPLCIASVVHRMPGWEVEVIDENNYRRHGPRGPDGYPDHRWLQRLRPAAVVGFYGGLSSTIPRLYDLARQYRAMGCATLAGGQHFIGENVDEALAHDIDVVLLGEAEDTIRECLPCLATGQALDPIAGLAYRRDGRTLYTAERAPPEDFDAYPIPDFSLLRYAKVTLFPVGRVRGCGMDCEFCTVKGRARYASPERLLEQVMSAVERWGARDFFIVDDLFGQDRQETLRLCDLLHEYQERIGRCLDFTVQIRLDKGRDSELLAAMRTAGVHTVAIGFESPIGEELEAMNKHLRPESMLALVREFRRQGFRLHGMFIFGYPLPAGVVFTMPLRERVRRFRRFVRQARLDTIQVLLPVPLPGTEMTRRLAASGRLLPRDTVGWEYYDGNFPLFLPDPPLTPEDLQAALSGIMGFFYRFGYMFSIGVSVLSFPVLLLHLHDLRAGWRRWHRRWRNQIIRFGGWLVIRRWRMQFRAGGFAERLALAKARLLAVRHGMPHPLGS